MAKYIDREALLKDISESVVFTVRGDRLSLEIRGANKVTDRIKLAPAADVVEVVRCKDCEKWDTSNRFLNTCACSRWSQSKSAPRLTKPDDFCSYGEKKGCANNG